MVIVKIIGGLGNQMFQYAYAKSLEIRGFEVKLDLSSFINYKLHGGFQLDKYNINIEQAKYYRLLFSRINPFIKLKEKNLMFDNNLLLLNGNEYIKGYFQTEKYFLEIRDLLLKQFTFSKEISNSTKKYKSIIKNKNSCSIHIRRGDYVSDSKTNNIHGICSLNYYKKAIELIKKKYENTNFYIFSDDITWTKGNLEIKNSVYIDHKCMPHEDIYLMSICMHNIIANSSFSWWGAWLNKNNDKTVIAPVKWFKTKKNEIIPENWTKI